MDTETTLRRTLQHLQLLFTQLEDIKHLPSSPERTSGRANKPGTTIPGGAATTLDIELTLQLKEIACDIRNHITPTRIIPAQAQPILHYLIFHTNLITQLDFAQDILEGLRTIETTLNNHLNPTPIDLLAARPEPWQPATHIINKLAAKGYTINRQNLSDWVRRGHINNIKDQQGRCKYRLTEVLETAQKLRKPPTN